MDQIVDITQDGRHISKDRGFLKVECEGQLVGRVPLDQIAAVIVHAHGITWSNSLLVELSERGIVVVLCAANHMPRSILLPLEGHHAQGARMRAQWSSPEPLRKQAWKRVVIAKIKMQAAALAAIGQRSASIEYMVRKVQSGDSTNVEAQAARAYWPLLFGPRFRRDPDSPDVNGLLNYGYTVLRAAMARAVVSVGLHPTFGIFHSNRGNAFALVDDLMEPFRPLVDLTAFSILSHSGPDVTPAAKQTLAKLIALDLPLTGETSPVSVAMSRLAVSLAQSFVSRKLDLALPDPPDHEILKSLGT